MQLNNKCCEKFNNFFAAGLLQKLSRNHGPGGKTPGPPQTAVILPVREAVKQQVKVFYYQKFGG